jgi:putative copper export protein
MWVLLACLLAVAVPVLAQSSPGYDLSWHVVGGGGGRLEGTAYTLHGTAGQPVVDLLPGGGYVLAGGFWVGGIYRVYLPLTLR